MGANTDWTNANYETLRQIARALMKNEWNAHTLQPTALLNEVLLRLRKRGWNVADRKSGTDPLVVVRLEMKRCLIEEARRRKALKRGEGKRPELLTDDIKQALRPGGASVEEIEAIHRACGDLEKMNPRYFYAVYGKYWVGLTNEEIAAGLKVSLTTAKNLLKEGVAYVGGQLRAR
jgi:DNA-directed RNA polymerase specialized sigma24 family protein